MNETCLERGEDECSAIGNCHCSAVVISTGDECSDVVKTRINKTKTKTKTGSRLKLNDKDVLIKNNTKVPLSL